MPAFHNQGKQGIVSVGAQKDLPAEPKYMEKMH